MTRVNEAPSTTQRNTGRCDKLLEMLWHMCSNDVDSKRLYGWVLKWLAYPIQHPGAKLKTTVVVHGPQGTDKNLFFESVMGIYGQYGGVIDQSAIDDKYNDWASRKLFMIADEVVARSKMWHIKNRLKTLITNKHIWINPKNCAAYWEENHLNLVFLSNDGVPVVLEEDDRRYCVIRTPKKLEQNFYQSVIDEIRDGGVDALRKYFLNFNLEDFNPDTAPPTTVDSVEAWEWGEKSFRYRRLRIAPCPQRESPEMEFCGHDLTVAACFPDELSHVYCTCGWVGPGAESDEKAVEQHNVPHGYGIEPVSDWSHSTPNLTNQEIAEVWERLASPPNLGKRAKS